MILFHFKDLMHYDKTSLSDSLFFFLFFFQQIRQADITTEMRTKALGALTQDLRKALEDAQENRAQQLEQFMMKQLQDQTHELKQAIEENRQRGVKEVVEELKLQHDKVMEEISKLTQAIAK